MLRLIQSLGAYALEQVEGLGRMGIFLACVLRGIIRPPGKLLHVVRQIRFIGSKSLFVIGFTGAFSGMVLALQGYYTLRKFGSEGLLGSAVALSLLRELGPVLSALMVTGRAGSAMCAEVGIMRIDEQIDALECMAIDPYSYLITPRLIACLIVMPLLTSFFDVVGMYGGYVVGVQLLGVNPGLFLDGIRTIIEWNDVYMGLIKSLFFAVLIIWICTYKGYYAGVDQGAFGPEQVGNATTSAVVLTSVAVLVGDYFVTSVML